MRYNGNKHNGGRTCDDQTPWCRQVMCCGRRITSENACMTNSNFCAYLCAFVTFYGIIIGGKAGKIYGESGWDEI